MATHEDTTRSGASCPAPQPAEDLLRASYQVAPEPFWQFAVLRGDDGYERIELARRYRWRAIASWGQDGWDLGSWPLVVISWRESQGWDQTRYEPVNHFDLAYNVEGDITVYRYPTAELREAATDYLAFWHWKHDDEPWVEGIDSVDAAPARLRGPFSRARLEAAKEAS